MSKTNPTKSDAEVLFPERDLVANSLDAPFRVNIPRLQAHFGYDRAQTEVLQKEHREMLGASVLAQDASAVHDLLTTHLIRPLSEEEHAASGREARQAIQDAYGRGHDAEKLLLEARAQVERNPTLKRALEDSNLGNHPQVVRALVRKILVQKGRQP
jgi:hypothetical protein